MIPWIQVYSNLPQHPKTSRLADELGLSSAALNPNAMAVGMLVSLWTWAIQNACNGDLSGCSARSIAEACLWKKKPDRLIQALKSAGFLDEDMKLHDWDEYAGLLMAQEEKRKAKARERVNRYRSRKMAEANGVTNEECNGADVTPCNVTDTLCNASTIPDQTIPYQTYRLSGGGGELPRAREASPAEAGVGPEDQVREYLETRGRCAEAYFGMTDELRDTVELLTQAIFKRFASRTPTAADVDNVFLAIRHSEQTPDGEWSITFPQDAKDLLLYAFEQASHAGKPGDWNYIHGILGRLSRRGIRTLEQAEDYELERGDG